MPRIADYCCAHNAGDRNSDRCGCRSGIAGGFVSVAGVARCGWTVLAVSQFYQKIKFTCISIDEDEILVYVSYFKQIKEVFHHGKK